MHLSPLFSTTHIMLTRVEIFLKYCFFLYKDGAIYFAFKTHSDIIILHGIPCGCEVIIITLLKANSSATHMLALIYTFSSPRSQEI